MGDIADAMLDGTLCQMCGEYIGEDVGYPMTCGGCAPDESAELDDTPGDLTGEMAEA